MIELAKIMYWERKSRSDWNHTIGTRRKLFSCII